MFSPGCNAFKALAKTHIGDRCRTETHDDVTSLQTRLCCGRFGCHSADFVAFAVVCKIRQGTEIDTSTLRLQLQGEQALYHGARGLHQGSGDHEIHDRLARHRSDFDEPVRIDFVWGVGWPMIIPVQPISSCTAGTPASRKLR